LHGGWQLTPRESRGCGRYGGCSSIAGDVGFMKPVITDSEGDDEFLMGLPFVNLSYRW
jgi:hypothetical protein